MKENTRFSRDNNTNLFLRLIIKTMGNKLMDPLQMGESIRAKK
jgi:hypothetical protein